MGGQAVRLTTKSQSDSSAARTFVSGSGARVSAASSAQPRGHLAGLGHHRVRAQQRPAPPRARRRRTGRRRARRAARASPGRVGPAQRCNTGSVGTPSRRSVPGVLPDSAESDATSSRSSESWNATPIRSPKLRRAARPRLVGRRRASRRTGRGARSASRSCRRARAGSARSGPRPRPARPSRGSARVTSRSNVRACIRTASGPRSARMSGRPGEQEVTGQDRDRVVPAGVRRVGARDAAAPRPSRRRGRASRGGSARRRRPRGRRPAPPGHRTARRAARAAAGTACRRRRRRCAAASVTNAVRGLHLVAQPRLDRGETLAAARPRARGRWRGRGCSVDVTERLLSGRPISRRSVSVIERPAWSARLSTGCGNDAEHHGNGYRRSRAHSRSRHPGRRPIGPSSTGSAKNISTMTRT